MNNLGIQTIDIEARWPGAAEVSKARSLRCVGESELLGRAAIGICGSRDATEQSLKLANRFGLFATKQGFVVVAGNARGVDEAAQRGALEAGGSTVAVLAEGLEGWAPRKNHRPLITAHNFVAVSKFEDSARWHVSRAMDRNRLIIGLSKALVVVQAGTDGGTWNAGLECLRVGKPLLVVQRREETPETEGNGKLIARGGIGVSSEKRLCDLLELISTGEVLPQSLQGTLL